MDFLWGTATAGHQVDGQNENSDWWKWEAEGHIEGGARSGLATDHRRLFRKDLELAASLGNNTYRFSFEWARFEPKEGEWDSSAEDWYHELLNECDRLGLLPMATLHHFTSPQWFAEGQGFAGPRAAEKFRNFTEKIVRRFGARIPLWCTINEPIGYVAGSYLGHFMPPGKHDPQAASRACHQLLRAHVFAYDTIHQLTPTRTGPFRDHPLMVGFAHNMLDFQAARKFHPIEQMIARGLYGVYNKAWLNGVTGRRARFGLPGFFPYAPEVREARGRVTADFIGVNYYTKALIHWHPKATDVEQTAEMPIGVSFARGNEPTSDLGWSFYPKGFARIIKLAASYKLPIYITENGIADQADRYRSEYLVSHLEVIADAIERGVDIRGYYYWSLMDNFEWIKGFGPRFGLYKVDYETFERRETASADVYRKLISAHSGGIGPSREKLAKFKS